MTSHVFVWVVDIYTSLLASSARHTLITLIVSVLECACVCERVS